MKTRKKWLQYLPFVLFLLVGFVCGWLFGKYIVLAEESGQGTGNTFFSLFLLIISLYLAFFLQIILHEGGHLLFGLLCGFRFSSFRIGNLIWLVQDGRIHLKRLSLAGTGGQCLMLPTEAPNQKKAYILYNMGGVFVNLLSSLLFSIFAFLCRNILPLSVWFASLAAVGTVSALVNGIPVRSGIVTNDGYHTLCIAKNPAALRAFQIQLQIVEQTSRGIRIKDMPQEWFEMPQEADMQDTLTSAIGVFVCNRQMDSMKLDDACRSMHDLLNMDICLHGLYRCLLQTDCIYCELVGEKRPEILGSLMDKPWKKFAKSMKHYPSILRTQYAYALLYEQNSQKAERCLAAFEKMARTYPYPQEIEGERELIQYARQKCA